MADANAPDVSVVVPTYARPDRLGRLIAALEAQDFAGAIEVVVVDDGSPEAAWNELQRVAAASRLEVRAIRQQPNRGPAAARNTGWRAARASLVAFTDDDCIPTPGWLSALVAAMADREVVQGCTLPDPDGVWGPFSRTVVATEEDFYATCNVGYHRAVLERVDGFDESYRRAGEDTDLAMRAIEAGGRTAFEPSAVVHHEVTPSSYRGYLREKRRWESVPLIVRNHPQLRARMHDRVFWRAAHGPAAAAAAGVVLAGLPTTRGLLPRAVAGLLLGLPYVRHRLRREPLPGVGPRRRVALLPLVLAGDVVEVAVLARGSLRYRTLVL